MVNLIELDDLPDNFELCLYSDVHVGAKSCHLEAFQEMLNYIRRKKNTYALFLGDAVEGQTTDHPHYDHTSIDDESEGYDMHTPDGQFQKFQDMIEPVAGKHLGLLKGNHDWRCDKIRPFLKHISQELAIPYLGPRAHVRAGNVNIFASHKGRALPKGAKDPGQRRANREAALKRNLEPFWGSANIMAHGHTHDLIVRRPLPPASVLMSDAEGNHRMRSVPWHLMGTHTEDGFSYVDPEARWYAVTGTFRRSGHVQNVNGDLGWNSWDDYAEREPYHPIPVGYAKFTVKKGEVVDGQEVVV